LLLLLGTYVLVEWHMVAIQFVNRTFVSHRTEYWRLSLEEAVNFLGATGRSLTQFFHGQTHAQTVNGFIIAIIVPMAVLPLLVWRKFDDQQLRWLLLLLICAVVISLIYGFERWTLFLPIKDKLPFLHLFQVRTYWFSPLIWYVILALSLAIIGDSFAVFGRFPAQFVVVVLILIQATLILQSNVEIAVPVKALLGTKWVEELSYAQFYSPDLFDEIADYINTPPDGYRVASVGMHPAIALYNGFYTLDSYQNNYPLAYKQQFRGLIAQELDKSEAWRNYYDNWGNRAYLFSAELDNAMYTKYDDATIYDFSLDTALFKEMGGRYILSAVAIDNHDAIGLDYLRTFERDDSPWRIFLYQAR
jgi:hypothetical protein